MKIGNCGAMAGVTGDKVHGDWSWWFGVWVGWWSLRFVWWRGEERPRCGITHHSRCWWLSKPKCLTV